MTTDMVAKGHGAPTVVAFSPGFALCESMCMTFIPILVHLSAEKDRQRRVTCDQRRVTCDQRRVTRDV